MKKEKAKKDNVLTPNEIIIDVLKKEYDIVNKLHKEKETLNEYLYKEKLNDLRDCSELSKTYELSDLKQKIEKQIQLYTLMQNEGIYLDTYYLTDDIYFQMWHQNCKLYCYFYIENNDWIHDEYIGSWSGVNDWITNFIDEEYSLFSMYSGDNMAELSIKDIFEVLKDEKVSNLDKLQHIKGLIDFIKGNGRFSKINKAVINTINCRLRLMKNMIED